MPSRMERFGLITSLELTKIISPMYRWFVGTKTLQSSSSSFSCWEGGKMIKSKVKYINQSIEISSYLRKQHNFNGGCTHNIMRL